MAKHFKGMALGLIAGAILGLLVGAFSKHVTAGLLTALVVGIVVFGAAELVERRKRREPEMPPRPGTDYPDLDVTIEHEEWHNFRHEARILEVRLRITNQTTKQKQLGSWELVADSGLAPIGPEVREEVERRRQSHQQLPDVIDPGETVSGWRVYPFGWFIGSDGPQYTLTVRDGQEFEYVAHRQGGGSAVVEPAIRVTGEIDPEVQHPKCRPSHRVDRDQVVLVLENQDYLNIPIIRCVVSIMGGRGFQADVNNPFATSEAPRIGPPNLELWFPRDFREAVLRPGAEHWATWYDTFDRAQTGPSWTEDHRLAQYRFRTIL